MPWTHSLSMVIRVENKEKELQEVFKSKDSR